MVINITFVNVMKIDFALNKIDSALNNRLTMTTKLVVNVFAIL